MYTYVELHLQYERFERSTRRVADKKASEEVVSKKLKAAASATLAIDGCLVKDKHLSSSKSFCAQKRQSKAVS